LTYDARKLKHKIQNIRTILCENSLRESEKDVREKTRNLVVTQNYYLFLRKKAAIKSSADLRTEAVHTAYRKRFNYIY
jgi:hypothetical protein